MFIKSKLSKSIFVSLIVAATLLLLSNIASADMDQREAKIQRELDCIANSSKNNSTYSWADVCYTKSTENSDTNVDASVEPNADLSASEPDNDRFYAAKFGISTGYRRDNLKWNIAGTLAGTSPNILSELTWSDLQSVQIQGKGEVVLMDHFVFEGNAAYARIFSGDNQDSDYLSNNRVNEFSRSNNSADKGNMTDFSGGLGYRINFEEVVDFLPVEKFSLTPLIGYAYNAQNLRMQDGFQTLNLFGSTGPFSGLNSTYETEWKGPWLGGELSAKSEGITVMFRFEYHLVDYYADADWNLRADFAHPKSFEHTADGNGYVIRAGLGYELSTNWNLNLGVDYYKYETDHGLDRTFYSDGTSADTRLNVVDWDSFALNAGLQYNF